MIGVKGKKYTTVEVIIEYPDNYKTHLESSEGHSMLAQSYVITAFLSQNNYLTNQIFFVYKICVHSKNKLLNKFNNIYHFKVVM